MIAMSAKDIRELRTRLKLTQRQLAELVHSTSSTVSNWETGISEPDIWQLRVLAILADRARPSVLLRVGMDGLLQELMKTYYAISDAKRDDLAESLRADKGE